MTWREFVLTHEGYRRRKSYEASQFRAIAYTIYCANVDSTNRKDIEEYWPLPTDEPTTQDDEEEADKLRAIMQRYKNGEY